MPVSRYTRALDFFGVHLLLCCQHNEKVKCKCKAVVLTWRGPPRRGRWWGGRRRWRARTAAGRTCDRWSAAGCRYTCSRSEARPGRPRGGWWGVHFSLFENLHLVWVLDQVNSSSPGRRNWFHNPWPCIMLLLHEPIIKCIYRVLNRYSNQLDI